MACASHCLGAAMATVARMPHFACANSQRCTPVGHLVFSLQQQQQLVSLPVAFGAGNVWKPAAVLRPGSQRMIVMASQEAGTSTLVVQEVEFIWKGPGSKVLLSGDFVNWESQVPLEKTGSDGWFVVKQKLAPGTYTYKYVVDGEWQHSPDAPTVADNAGGFNNEITVGDSKSAPQSASKESNAEPAQAKAVEAKEAASKSPAEAKEVKEAAPKPPASSESVPPVEAKEVEEAAPKPPASSESVPPVEAKEVEEAAPKPKPSPPKPKVAAAAAGAKPKVAAAGGAKKAKAVVKPLLETMVEDVVPKLTAYFEEKEKGISDVEIEFADNQLQGSFIKNQVPYNFWAYFPDGKLEGSRGFSLTSHGSAPSTVEPFLIDESKITGEAVVQQVIKRLFAQMLLSTN